MCSWTVEGKVLTTDDCDVIVGHGMIFLASAAGGECCMGERF